MKFGLFFNPQVPKPLDSDDWERGQEGKRFAEMIEQVRSADSLGFDYVFLGEHHFTAEYAHNTAPEVVLGYLTAVTERMRLGTGITHMSHNDPIRTAERIATIDMLSGGRVEFGFGAGGAGETLPFVAGNDEYRRGRYARASQIAVDILGERGVYPGTDDEFFRIPAVNIVPKSTQSPHPPLWTSTLTAQGTVDAARRGVGNLLLTVTGSDDVARHVESYWETLLTECTPMGAAVNPAVFAFTHALVAETDEIAVERSRRGLEYFAFGLTGGAKLATSVNTSHLHRDFENYREGRCDAREAVGMPGKMAAFQQQMITSPGNAIGSEGTVRRVVGEIEAAHADALLFTQLLGETRHEHIMESIERLGTNILPEFRARHDEHVAWREEKLRGFPHPIKTSV